MITLAINITTTFCLAWILFGSLVWLILLQTDVVTLIDPRAVRSHGHVLAIAHSLYRNGRAIVRWPFHLWYLARDWKHAWPKLKELWGIS